MKRQQRFTELDLDGFRSVQSSAGSLLTAPAANTLTKARQPRHAACEKYMIPNFFPETCRKRGMLAILLYAYDPAIQRSLFLQLIFSRNESSPFDLFASVLIVAIYEQRVLRS